MAVLKSGKHAALVATTGGGQLQVQTRHGRTATVKGEDGVWRRNNRNGSMTKVPHWDDDAALSHGEKRHSQDEKSGVQPYAVTVFNDRRFGR